MGHTHYWYLRTTGREAVEGRLGDILQDFARLLPHLPPLAGPDGTGGPVLYPPEVAFNGPAPEDYESFVFPWWEEREWSFGFCKTGPGWEDKRPFDLAVRVFLLLAKLHLGDLIRVASDAPLRDWAEAALLVEGVLALPVDLYGLLGVRLLEVEDTRGRRFLLERWKEDDSGLGDWLQARERLDREGLFPWPFRGPYRVLGEVHLPQEELPRRWAREGFYRRG